MQLNRSFPWLATIGKIGFGLACAAPVFYFLLPGALFSLSFSELLLPSFVSLFPGWLGHQYLFDICLKKLFGEEKATFGIKNEGQGRKGCEIQSTQRRAGILSFFNIHFPYKLTIAELETDIYSKAYEKFNRDSGLPTPENINVKYYAASSFDLEEVKTFTKLYSKEIVQAHPQYFYATAQSEISQQGYQVDAAVAEYRRKRHII